MQWVTSIPRREKRRLGTAGIVSLATHASLLLLVGLSFADPKTPKARLTEVILIPASTPAHQWGAPLPREEASTLPQQATAIPAARPGEQARPSAHDPGQRPSNRTHPTKEIKPDKAAGRPRVVARLEVHPTKAPHPDRSGPTQPTPAMRTDCDPGPKQTLATRLLKDHQAADPRPVILASTSSSFRTPVPLAAALHSEPDQAGGDPRDRLAMIQAQIDAVAPLAHGSSGSCTPRRGRARIEFLMGPTGYPLAWRLLSSTGVPCLDYEVGRILHLAKPYPWVAGWVPVNVRFGQRG